MFDVGLHFCVGELAADEALRIEDTTGNSQYTGRLWRLKEGNSRVDWVHRDLVFGGIADESFGVGERNVGWGRPVALVVGDDLYTIILPHTDATR